LSIIERVLTWNLGINDPSDDLVPHSPWVKRVVVFWSVIMPDKEVRIRVVARGNQANYYVYVVNVDDDISSDTEVRYAWKPLRVMEWVAAALRLGKVPE
jgi:hypothetical protein